MEIHDLNTKALTDPAYVAFDDGEDTYKTEFNECVENAANAAVAAADLTENEVAFTSGDAASTTAWTNVSVITTGSTLATLFNRISTMVKNVRWLYSKLGTTDISSIGNGTVTGALSTLNGKVTPTTMYRPLSADQKSTWSYNVPHTGTLYLGFIGTTRAYCTINWNGAIIGSVAMANSSIALTQTTTVYVKKDDVIRVTGLSDDCYLSSGLTALIAMGAD